MNPLTNTQDLFWNSEITTSASTLICPQCSPLLHLYDWKHDENEFAPLGINKVNFMVFEVLVVETLSFLNEHLLSNVPVPLLR